MGPAGSEREQLVKNLFRSPRSRLPAFTLVELLVVIGIIGLLISILLPVMSRVQGRAKTLACQANMRSIGQAFFGYAAEFKGSMPWGWCWDRFSPTTGQGFTPGDYYDWASTVSQYVNRRREKGVLMGTGGGTTKYADLSKMLRCPEVQSDATFNHGTDYTAHPVIFPDRDAEMGTHFFGEGPGLAGSTEFGSPAPAKQTRLYSDNALLWDSPAFAVSAQYADSTIAYVGYSVIDGQGLNFPQSTFSRYRGKVEGTDTIGDAYYGWQEMILMHNNSQQPWNANVDITPGGSVSNGTVRRAALPAQ